MDRMLTIRIHMSAEQWRMMQPEKASRLATAMAVVQHPTTRQALDAAAGIVAEKTHVEGEHRPPDKDIGERLHGRRLGIGD